MLRHQLRLVMIKLSALWDVCTVATRHYRTHTATVLMIQVAGRWPNGPTIDNIIMLVLAREKREMLSFWPGSKQNISISIIYASQNKRSSQSFKTLRYTATDVTIIKIQLFLGGFRIIGDSFIRLVTDDIWRGVVGNPLSSDDTSSHYQQIRANPLIVITNSGIKIRRIQHLILIKLH